MSDTDEPSDKLLKGIEELLKRHSTDVVETMRGVLSSLQREPSVTIINKFTNYGTITGNVTIHNTLQTMKNSSGTADIAKVFEALLKELQESKAILTTHERRALVGAAEDLTEEAAKPAKERDSSKLKDAWTYLTGAISAAKGLVEIADHWEKWSKVIENFFNSSGSSLS